MENSNADKLGVIAIINIIITIIASVIVPLTDGNSFNWIGILIVGGIILSGFTLYYLLKTIIDIYYEVEKQ